MDNDRTRNLLGALASALTDDIERQGSAVVGHGAAAPAALATIATDPGQTIDQLRRILRLSHSGAVRLIDRLAGAGLVERQPGADGRSVALYLTERGIVAAAGVQHVRSAALDSALGNLSSIEQTQLSNLLERMLAALVVDREHADHICRLCDEEVCPLERCPVEIAALQKSSR